MKNRTKNDEIQQDTTVFRLCHQKTMTISHTKEKVLKGKVFSAALSYLLVSFSMTLPYFPIFLKVEVHNLVRVRTTLFILTNILFL